MLDSLAVTLAVSVLLGFLSGLGIGGGSLLVLWLTIVLGMDPATARGINLLFFLPSAFIACCFRWKQGCIRWKQLLPAILSGCTAAAVFSWIGAGMNTQLLKKLFGGLLFLTGLRELFYRPKMKG